jgi:DNA-binding Lrp family transcriptional regulator
MMDKKLDSLDKRILRELANDGRMSQTDLSERVGLSATACARRLARLEEGGIIRGYSTNIDAEALGFVVSVFVQVTLERQSEEALAAFEKAIARCPEVSSCHLMSGTNDYLVQVQARNLADYERIHKQHLSRMPGVAKLQSGFAMRTVVKRTFAPALFAD